LIFSLCRKIEKPGLPGMASGKKNGFSWLIGRWLTKFMKILAESTGRLKKLHECK
jgi:hypothetical protein